MCVWGELSVRKRILSLENKTHVEVKMLVSLCVETEHTDTLSSAHLAGSGPETTKLVAYYYSQSLKILEKSLPSSSSLAQKNSLQHAQE